MKLTIFEGKMGNLLAENRLLKFTVVVIGISTIWLGWRVDNAVHHQRTIIMPASLDRRISITDSYASEDYVRSFARTISGLAFNYNPTSARGQFGELLQYFTPDTFPAAKQSFFAMAETIERTKVSSSFVINRPIEVDTTKNVMSVSGTLRQWVDTTFNDVSEKTYQISYAITEGRFFLTAITEKAKNNVSPQAEAVKPSEKDSTALIKVGPESGEAVQK